MSFSRLHTRVSCSTLNVISLQTGDVRGLKSLMIGASCLPRPESTNFFPSSVECTVNCCEVRIDDNRSQGLNGTPLYAHRVGPVGPWRRSSLLWLDRVPLTAMPALGIRNNGVECDKRRSNGAIDGGVLPVSYDRGASI